MKIRTKVFIASASLITLQMLLSIFFSYNLLYKDALEKEIINNSYFSKQVLTNTVLLTDSIENHLFNSYTVSYIPELLKETSEYYQKVNTVTSNLNSICYSTPYIPNIMVIDQDGKRYYGTDHPDSSASLSVFDKLILPNSLEVDFTKNIEWIVNENGRLFLKENLNSILPLQNMGIIVAEIDLDYFKSTIGLNNELNTTMAISNSEGLILVSNGNLDNKTIHSIIPTINDGKEFQWENVNNDKYCIITKRSSDQSWNILSMIPQSIMFDSAEIIQNSNIIIVLLVGLVAVFIAIMLSKMLTRNISKILESMNQVSHGDFNNKLNIKSRDEIGKLASKFNWMIDKIRDVTDHMVDEATQKEQARYELLELKYRSLQTQISPHYICNILASINAFAIMGETDKVSQLSITASHYLRNNLQNNQEKYIPLYNELESINDYIALYRIIYGMKFQFNIHIDEDFKSIWIPNQILQPLVENSLTHGYKDYEDEQLFCISIYPELIEDYVIIRVIDNGQGFSDETIKELNNAILNPQLIKSPHVGHLGFGLMSVLQRLNLLYPGNASIDVNSNPSIGTTITLTLPLVHDKVTN